MPKRRHEQVHFFIIQALTSNDANLSNYRDEEFKTSIRLVAIESIIAILERIRSEQIRAKLNKDEFSLQNMINTPNPITGLNMLDYCLVAGFDEIAIHLMHLGATSTHVDSLRKNISNTFGNNFQATDFMREVNSIIESCVEIKQNCDQIVERTNKLIPKIAALGKKIYEGYNTPTLIALGIGCLVLIPILHPLAHGAGGIAAVVSAGLLPGVISGTRRNTPRVQNNTVAINAMGDEDDSIKILLLAAKSTRGNLQETYKPRLKHAAKSHGNTLPKKYAQVSLLHQLENTKSLHLHKKKKQDITEAEEIAALRNIMLG